jgi:hypothetical protein
MVDCGYTWKTGTLFLFLLSDFPSFQWILKYWAPAPLATVLSVCFLPPSWPLQHGYCVGVNRPLAYATGSLMDAYT